MLTKKILVTVIFIPIFVIGIIWFFAIFAIALISTPIFLIMALVQELMEEEVDAHRAWLSMIIMFGGMMIYLPIDYIWDTTIEDTLDYHLL